MNDFPAPQDRPYSIGALAERTGLSAHVIRAWEKRYGVLSPDRTETNRRTYGSADVERLTLLRRATQAGHSIGMVAQLSDQELATLLTRGQSSPSTDSHSEFLDHCIAAISELDSNRLATLVERASTVMGVTAFLEDVVTPLIHYVSEGWESGKVGVAQEHLASAVIRIELGRVLNSLTPPEGAPKMLVTTPSGQLHELGALIVAVVGAGEGWDVAYVGPNLPHGEIASAANRLLVDLVALSLVYPTDDPAMGAELDGLRKGLRKSIPILVGGRAVGAYRAELSACGAEVVQDLGDLRKRLQSRSSLGL